MAELSQVCCARLLTGWLVCSSSCSLSLQYSVPFEDKGRLSEYSNSHKRALTFVEFLC